MMSRRLECKPLTPENIGPAYTLARMRSPALTPAAWRRQAVAYAHPGLRSRKGALTVADERGCLTGLALWRVLDGPAFGRALWIDLLVAADLVSAGPAAEMLVRELDRTAIRQRCTEIVLAALGGDSPAPPGFTSAGQIWRRVGVPA